MAEQTQKSLKRIPVVRSLKLTGDGTSGVLLGRKCRNCGTYFMGAPVFCLKCSSAELDPVELSKQGILRTYTVIYVPPPGWQGQVPYILGSVELPEGVDVLSEVVDLPREAIKIGMKMEMVLTVGGKDAEGNQIMVYKWRPAK
jgi:hypothetical protein